MSVQINENKLIEIFIDVDDFCKEADKWLRQSGNGHDFKWSSALHYSEAMTVLIFYHHSGYKCFQYYYERLVRPSLKSYFPAVVNYKYFLSFIPKLYPLMHIFLQWRCARNERTGQYYVDSKKLPVCENQRIHSNQVFQGVARRGKSSTGWFYGLKVHLVINNLGQVVNFLFTSANFADNNKDVLRTLFKGLKGNCYGDKGYITKLFEYFFSQGLRLITKVRRNMKAKLIQLHERYALMKRGVIESVNDILMTVLDIEHTRHRSPVNAMVHMNACLVAYDYLDQKPTVILPNLISKT
ncbi:IS982 family transposase [Phaeodactylibacter xiamenensis]|jgi:hypothetical protein|uniref:IS982 family transposase n=1 Tax=Phaeodactylibacter xiamenensis TaxID=1524460 RepID=UPI003BAC1A61